MPKLNTAKSQQVYAELSKAIGQQSVLDALERAGKNRQLLRKAKRDPESYLRGEGVRLPPRVEVTISERRIIVGQIRICVTVCRRVGPIILCVTMCTRIIIIVIG